MTQAIKTTYVTLHQYRERIFTVLVVAIFITAGAYVFLLQRAIVNVIARESIVHQVSMKSTEVGTLEANYFTLENSITLSLAHSKGFKDAPVTAFISKTPVTAMASYHGL